MVPKINNQGHSFKGIIAYLMHDKKSRETSERVRWYETGNMLTDDPEKAAKVMSWTDLHSDHLKEQSGGSRVGRKPENGAVYHFSLAWHGEETPDAKHQHEYALANLKKLNLQNHEYVLVAHNDSEHDHVHVVVNLTNPETGKRAELKYSKRKMQGLALEYEKEHGIYCEKRFKNEREREKARLTHQVTRAYELSDNGQSFKSAMEAEGLILAAGRNNKRLVFIDQKGKIQAVARFLKTDEASPTQALRNRFADLDMNSLPEADRRAEEIKAKNEQLNKKSEGVKRDFKKAVKGEILEPAQKQQATRRKTMSAEEQKERQEENLKRYLGRIQEQSVRSREKWNIDALAKARDAANAAHEKGQGYRTGATLKKAENALKEGQEQFRADLLGINKNRPKWAIGKELKQQGLSPVVTEKELEYLRKVEAAQQEQREEAALKAKYYDELFAKKAAASRKEWAIDELVKEWEEARRNFDKAKVFNADDEKYHVAEAALKNAEKILDNHMKWFRDDMILINRNRAPWTIERELEKHGLPKGDLDKAIAQAHERAERLQEKQAAYHRGRAEFEELERVCVLNRKIGLQTEKSRKHWGIDKIIADKEAAQRAFEQSDTMRGAITGRKKQAAEGLEVTTKTHQDRMHHFKNEILWFNRMKSKEEIGEVLRAQGLESDYPLPKRDMRIPAEREAAQFQKTIEKKHRIKTEKEAKAKQLLLAKRLKEVQKERELHSQITMEAQFQKAVEVPERIKGIEKPLSKGVEKEGLEYEQGKRLEQAQQKDYDLSLQNRATALEAAESGELGKGCQEMARGELDADSQKKIRKAWIEAQQGKDVANDNELSIQQERGLEISNESSIEEEQEIEL